MYNNSFFDTSKESQVAISNTSIVNRLYHGTTDALKITDIVLPAIETSILREDFRKKNLDVCFATSSLLSAKNYARKATLKYGGNPIIFEVKPIGSPTNINNNEYICEKFKIIRKIDY